MLIRITKLNLVALQFSIILILNTTTYHSVENSAAVDTSLAVKSKTALRMQYIWKMRFQSAQGYIRISVSGSLIIRYQTGIIFHLNHDSSQLSWLLKTLSWKLHILQWIKYIHLLTGSSPNMQNDIWVPVTDAVTPPCRSSMPSDWKKPLKTGGRDKFGGLS